MGIDSALGMVVMVLFGAVQSLGIPVLWIVAASMLWNVVPKWIPAAFLANGVAGIVVTIPSYLMQFGMLSPAQFGSTYAYSTFFVRLGGGIFSAVALVRLAMLVKGMVALSPETGRATSDFR